MRELTLSILDLAQNSIRSGASVVKISVIFDDSDQWLTISVEDDGCGMDKDCVLSVTDPFYTTCDKHTVGLGVPLFIQRALLTGGDYKIWSEKGSGTGITAVFNTHSVDCVPLGNVAEALTCLITSFSTVSFLFSYKRNNRQFSLDTVDLFKKLGVQPEQSLLKAKLIKAYLSDKIFQ